jgi:hypothetical protein
MITGKIKIPRQILSRIKRLPYEQVPHIKMPKRWKLYPRQCLDHYEYGSAKNEIEWYHHFRPKGTSKVGYLFTKLLSGNIVPPHRDHFENYMRYHGITDKNLIKRRLVFLEDWKNGHYFQVNERVFIKWKQGEWVEWNHKDIHLGGNIGTSPRYVLQITYSK